MEMEANKKVKKTETTECFRLDPEQRLCPQFDSVSIAKYTVADREHMGFRVVDNFTEEHIM